MAKPIQIYLQWEIRLNLDYLYRPIRDFAVEANAYKLAIEYQLPITVNQFRRDIGLPPHPDERGEMFVWQDDVVKPDDNVIPSEQLLAARRSLETNFAGRLDKLPVEFPELWAATESLGK